MHWRRGARDAGRHGDPQNIVLRLEFEGSMFGMEIRDDGRGFAGTPPDGAAGHFGLTGMRERAELLGGTLDAGPTSTGFRVLLKVPA